MFNSHFNILVFRYCTLARSVNLSHDPENITVNSHLSLKKHCDELTVWRVDWLPSRALKRALKKLLRALMRSSLWLGCGTRQAQEQYCIPCPYTGNAAYWRSRAYEELHCRKVVLACRSSVITCACQPFSSTALMNEDWSAVLWRNNYLCNMVCRAVRCHAGISLSV